MQKTVPSRSCCATAFNLFATLTTVFVLAGCAALPTAPARNEVISTDIAGVLAIRQFSLNGRVAVRYEEQGFSASLRWQHTPETDDLLILSPLGQGIAQITRDGTGVKLVTADQREFQAADAEDLTQQVLGWRLPLKGLGYWAVGTPAPGAFGDAERDAEGRLTGFSQDGWRVAYRNYQSVEGAMLPSRIELVRPNLEIKLIVDAWQAPKT